MEAGVGEQLLVGGHSFVLAISNVGAALLERLTHRRALDHLLNPISVVELDLRNLDATILLGDESFLSLWFGLLLEHLDLGLLAFILRFLLRTVVR